MAQRATIFLTHSTTDAHNALLTFWRCAARSHLLTHNTSRNHVRHERSCNYIVQISIAGIAVEFLSTADN